MSSDKLDHSAERQKGSYDEANLRAAYCRRLDSERPSAELRLKLLQAAKERERMLGQQAAAVYPAPRDKRARFSFVWRRYAAALSFVLIAGVALGAVWMALNSGSSLKTASDMAPKAVPGQADMAMKPDGDPAEKSAAKQDSAVPPAPEAIDGLAKKDSPSAEMEVKDANTEATAVWPDESLLGSARLEQIGQWQRTDTAAAGLQYALSDLANRMILNDRAKQALQHQAGTEPAKPLLIRIDFKSGQWPDGDRETLAQLQQFWTNIHTEQTAALNEAERALARQEIWEISVHDLQRPADGSLVLAGLSFRQEGQSDTFSYPDQTYHFKDGMWQTK